MASLRTGVLCVLLVAMLAVFASAETESCPANESWYICGTLCEPTCDDPKPNPMLCPGIECTASFTGGCRCNQGFVRNTNNNQCVPLSEC
ncbi:unnamed protein product [Xylocopa violacea]|uniref:TIL domain-containing protein n=1 Tax=Xylocopa violacea TaxID=135666 RepID=A0ABP1NEZ4_XYLVO